MGISSYVIGYVMGLSQVLCNEEVPVAIYSKVGY